MIELIGSIGAFLLAVCGLPAALQSYKEGNSKGINTLFLSSWYLGELFTLIYILNKQELDWPLILNYGVNLVFITVIIRYKIIPRK